MHVYIEIYIHVSQARQQKLCICKLQHDLNYSVEKETERLHKCSRFTFRLTTLWVLMDSSGRNLGSLSFKKEKVRDKKLSME